MLDVQREQGATIMYPTARPQVWQCSVWVRQSQVRGAGECGEEEDGEVGERSMGEDEEEEEGDDGFDGTSSVVVEWAEQFTGSASVE